MSVNTKMTAIADEIRILSGTSEAMGLDAMATKIGEANDAVDTQAGLIAQIATALEGKASASEPVLQTKTVTPTESTQNVTPDSGYDGLSKVTVNAIPSAYVKPTSTKAATTYTPTTSDQTIASGTYCSGTQTIKGDANLIAANIKSGVSIFGVTGTASGGSSGGGSVETCTGRVAYSDMMSFGYERLTATTYYTSSDLSVETIEACEMTQQITTVKGSLLYMSTPSSTIVEVCDNATLINSATDGIIFSIDADSFMIGCIAS